MIWLAILLSAVGCYLLKLSGLVVPARLLERPMVQRVALLVPVALLASLVTVQTVTTEHDLRLDARAPAVAVAAVAIVLRAPFLLVVVLAALTAAGLRAL